MAALALVVPPTVVSTAVLSYVSHHVGAYAARGIFPEWVVVNSAQARAVPPALLGLQVIIRGDLNGAA